VLCLVTVLLALTLGALVIASVVVASQRARLAADLGALTGASTVQDGASAGPACAVAQRVARSNGAALHACSTDGGDVELVVLVPAALWPQPATARARAGPKR
jgi:secretion/DNA translocation related TadE-like protein